MGKPKITLQVIRARASDQSFARGENYYHSGAITDTVRRGDDIEARCEGSYREPYRVWAQLRGSDIVAVSCTCEYDWSGDCKHLVALLLAYLHEPDRFEERLPLHDALMQRSKEDLADLIEQMVALYPDLQDMVDRPTPATTAQQETTIDVQAFRRELRRSLRFSGEWMDRTAESKVYEIASAGERFARRGDYASAVAIYCTILEECNASEYPTDDEGDYVVAVNHTVALLREALSHISLSENDALRQRVLGALVGAFIWDVDFGGIGYGDDAPDLIVEMVRPTDIKRIRQPIEAAQQRRSQSRYGGWGVEAYERFLIQLDALDAVDPEETLKRLRAQGLHLLLAAKLLDLKRPDEAVAVIREHLTGSHALERGLDLLASHGQAEQAIQLAEEAVSREYDKRPVNWLIALYHKQGEREGEFRWQLRRMQTEASIDHYIGLQTASKAVGSWDIVRPQMLAELNHKQAYETMTLAYLHDEAWDLAWETLDKVPSTKHPRPVRQVGRLDFTVAEKSRHARPARAIPVYIKYVRVEIEARNRKHYARAAQLLSEVRSLYHQVEDATGWTTLIAALRAEFRQLPALQDELKKARL